MKQTLSHVLWIGGATDAGKTTVARILAQRYGFQSYHYDQHDLRHHEQLAKTSSYYRAYLAASLDDRWVRPEPEDLVQRSLRSFRDRLPLVAADLQAEEGSPRMIAEGFGLTPELLAPVLPSQRQAIWLVPTSDFKWASMRRRNKPSFQDRVSDPDRAVQNLFRRDMLLAEHVRTQARLHGLRVFEVDEAYSIEKLAAVVEDHFEPLLPGRNLES